MQPTNLKQENEGIVNLNLLELYWC